jgi:hypothetical protein
MAFFFEPIIVIPMNLAKINFFRYPNLLGSLKVSYKVFGTQMTFFFETTIVIPMNLAFTLFTPLVSM